MGKVKSEGGQIVKYPYTLNDVRRDHPNTMFPGDFDEWHRFGAFDVVETPRPAGDVVEESVPSLVNGVWTQQWSVRSHTAEEIKPLIAARRYQEETKGTTVNGIPVDTDRKSQALITGAALAATIDPAYVCQWKTSDGFITLDAAAIIGVATAVRNHVQGCFDREAELIEAVDAGTYTSDMINEGWPE